jgi:hypothetical protein
MSIRFSRSPSGPTRFSVASGSPAGARRPLLLVVLVAVALFALGCGVQGISPFGQGRVGVALTDRPGDDFVSVHMTVSRIELLGDRKSVLLFDGLETFDLLQLRDASELFSMADGIPAGRYRGIRVFLEEIEVTRPGEDGSPQVLVVELPEERWMDLQPSEGIVVGAGETRVVEIDLALRESLVQRGWSGLALRPACEVKVLSEGRPGRLARIHGKAVKIDAQSGELRVCRTHFAMGPRQDRFQTHPAAHRCVDVVVGASASLFDSQGDPLLLGEVEPGSEVAAFGRFRLDQSQDPQHPLSLRAGLLLMGEAESIVRVRGRLASRHDAALERVAMNRVDHKLRR